MNDIAEQPVERVTLTVVTDGTYENTRLVDNHGRIVEGVRAIDYASDWHDPFHPVVNTVCSAKVAFERLNLVRVKPAYFDRTLEGEAKEQPEPGRLPPPAPALPPVKDDTTLLEFDDDDD